MAGDIFLLGTTSWMIRRVSMGTVRVENARGAPPSIPFWRGEGPGAHVELSHEVAELRRGIDERDDSRRAWLRRRVRRRCGRRGTGRRLRARRQGDSRRRADRHDDRRRAFLRRGGGMQLILHTPFGARINRAWGLALRKKFCRSFNVELQAAATITASCSR
jgi:ATP-dependent Lhr-like helicase